MLSFWGAYTWRGLFSEFYGRENGNSSAELLEIWSAVSYHENSSSSLVNHRHFGDFTENIVVAEIEYRLLHVLSFCNQERLFLFIFKIEVSVVLQTTWKDYQLIKYLELVCQLGPGTFEKLWMDITKFCCQPFCFSCANHGFLMVSSPWSCSLGSLSNDDGDVKENRKKAIGLY